LPVTSQEWLGSGEILESNRWRRLIQSFIDGSKFEHSQDEDGVCDDGDDYSDSEIAYESPDEYSDSETICSDLCQQLPSSSSLNITRKKIYSSCHHEKEETE